MFKNFKTSTQISLKFTIFSAGILLVIAIMMNLFFFYFWYFGMQKPKKIPPPSGIHISHSFAPDKKFQHHELHFAIHSDEARQLLEEEQWMQIVEIDSYYLYFWQDGPELRIRNVTQQVELQFLLLWISVAVVFVGTLLSYLVSLFFVQTALKKLRILNTTLENLDIDSLDQNIETSGPSTDEINKVASKLNQALEKIALQTRGLKDFVRNASHELKTPLMGISSLISLAHKSRNYESAFDQIKNEIKSMDNLLDTLLLITQVEEKVYLHKEDIDITQEIKSLINQFQLQYQEKSLTVELDIPAHLNILVNPQGRSSIVRNLISNAFKFVAQYGTIRVRLSESEFEVRNSGEEIPIEHQEYIRERFWQADRSRSDRKSFGLGLYLAKLFADKQEFKLSCESNKGEGVKFILKF